ncbi:MAG TPA: alpha/beta hydrolase [Candidatus Paceibacterota bacterium]
MSVGEKIIPDHREETSTALGFFVRVRAAGMFRHQTKRPRRGRGNLLAAASELSVTTEKNCFRFFKTCARRSGVDTVVRPASQGREIVRTSVGKILLIKITQFMSKKRVIIVHGWDGHPEEGWFPWLKNELEKLGFEVLIPQMPDAANPRIYNWVPALAKSVGTADTNTYFVGHSMGCQTIIRYLESLPEKKKVGGAVFIAGFLKRLTGLEDDTAVRETDRHWLTTPIDLDKVKKQIGKTIAVFSDNDPWVPLDNRDEFENKLGSKIFIEHGKGHFSGIADSCFELPIVLDSILEIVE